MSLSNNIEKVKSSQLIDDIDSRPHQFSVVRSPAKGKQLRKVVRADGTSLGADNVVWVSATSKALPTLPALHDFLSVQIGYGLNAALCYGKAVGASKRYEGGSETVHRQAWNLEGSRESGFADVPSDLLFIDIDDARLSDLEDWRAKPESAVQAMIDDNLPEFMHDTSFVWMWTASHGKNPDMLRVRLIYQLDRAICAGERKQLLAALHAHFDPVDAGIYGPERLIYFARPLFEVGAHDPLEGRQLTGYVEAGEDKLVVPGATWLEKNGGPLQALGSYNSDEMDYGADREINQLALADLGAWIHDLGIDRLEAVDGGFVCPAFLRESSSGQPYNQRKLQFEIHESGPIKDRGTGRTYQPVDLVMKARDLSRSRAWSWLFERVGVQMPDWIHAATNRARQEARQQVKAQRIQLDSLVFRFDALQADRPISEAFVEEAPQINRWEEWRFARDSKDRIDLCRLKVLERHKSVSEAILDVEHCLEINDDLNGVVYSAYRQLIIARYDIADARRKCRTWFRQRKSELRAIEIKADNTAVRDDTDKIWHKIETELLHAEHEFNIERAERTGTLRKMSVAISDAEQSLLLAVRIAGRDTQSNLVSLEEGRRQLTEMFDSVRTDGIAEMHDYTKRLDAVVALHDFAKQDHSSLKNQLGAHHQDTRVALAKIERLELRERWYAENPPTAKVASLPVGIGKTRAAGKFFDGSINVLISAPTNALNEEFPASMLEHGNTGHLQLIRGFDADDYLDTEWKAEGRARRKMCLFNDSSSALRMCAGSGWDMCGSKSKLEREEGESDANFSARAEEQNSKKCALGDRCTMLKMTGDLAEMFGSGRMYGTVHPRLTSSIIGIDHDNPLDLFLLDENFTGACAGSNSDSGQVRASRTTLDDLRRVPPAVLLNKNGEMVGDSTASKRVAYFKAAENVQPILVAMLDEQFARYQKARDNELTEDDKRNITPDAGIKFYSEFEGNPYERKKFAREAIQASHHYHALADAKLEGFIPNLQSKPAWELWEEVGKISTAYRRIAHLLTDIAECMFRGVDDAGRFMVFEGGNPDGSISRKIKHLRFQPIHESLISRTTILIMNAVPELSFQIEKALSYEIQVGGELVEIKGKEVRKGSRRYRAKRVVEYLPAINLEVCPNLNTTLIDAAPTSVTALGLDDVAKDVDASEVKIDTKRRWPVIEDKSGTGTNNRFKVIRLLMDIAASSDGKMFVAAKKTMLGWIRNKLGKDGQDTLDLLSFGRTAGTNKFEEHSTATLWSYDRLSPDAVAEIVQTFTGEHIDDRSSYGTEVSVNVAGEGGIEQQIVSPTYQFQNYLMSEYADWKRHSTVVQTMGRLRPHNEQDFRRDFIVALKGDMPLVFDNVIRWTEIDKAMTRQDWAVELQELLEKAPLPQSFEYADKIHPGRFKSKDDLNWYLKTRTSADEEGTSTIVVAPIYIFIKGTTMSDVSSDTNKNTVSGSSVGKVAFRIAGSASRFIDVLHAEESDKVAAEKLIGALRKSGVRQKLEFKHDVYAPLTALVDAPVGAKAIAAELGVTRGQANSMSKAIKDGAISDTHNLVYIQGMRDGKKFGNEIPRAIKRNYSAAEIIRQNRDRYPFDGFVIRWPELEEQPK